MPESLALAVDLGGTKVEAALVDSSGRLVQGSRSRFGTGRSRSTEELADSVRNAAMGAMAALPRGERIDGVGIGAAGPVNQSLGLVSPLNLPQWQDFSLADLLQECVPDSPVTLRIDGLCITLAEHWLGSARDARNVMGMVVSTGIGGGLILDGRAMAGPTGNAGHIGHVEVSGFTERCACGGVGCLEAIASGPNTVAWAKAQGWEGASGEDLAKSYLEGSTIARDAVARSGRAIGKAIGSASSLLDLDVVAIGGGFSRISVDLVDFIRRGLEEHTTLEYARRVKIKSSVLSDEGPLIGAAALVHRPHMLT